MMNARCQQDRARYVYKNTKESLSLSFHRSISSKLLLSLSCFLIYEIKPRDTDSVREREKERVGEIQE